MIGYGYCISTVHIAQRHGRDKDEMKISDATRQAIARVINENLKGNNSKYMDR